MFLNTMAFIITLSASGAPMRGVNKLNIAISEVLTAKCVTCNTLSQLNLLQQKYVTQNSQKS
jgi:hypothetical protein